VVREYGCWALAYLAYKYAQNMIAIAHADGIGAFVAAMRQHKDVAKVRHYGCWALDKLAWHNAQNQIAIAEADAIGCKRYGWHKLLAS
jgi:hypothetical protein